MAATIGDAGGMESPGAVRCQRRGPTRPAGAAHARAVSPFVPNNGAV